MGRSTIELVRRSAGAKQAEQNRCRPCSQHRFRSSLWEEGGFNPYRYFLGSHKSHTTHSSALQLLPRALSTTGTRVFRQAARVSLWAPTMVEGGASSEELTHGSATHHTP